jgi:hypothetical protein
MAASADRAAPRIFGIPAAAAPVVAVLRRGPTDWWHVGRWNTSAETYEAGAWFKGALYPQKCDLSPDGRWLAYSALKGGATWEAGTIYEAISRLPWLQALAAWNAGTTYTRGFHFAPEPGTSDLGDPDVGDATPCLRRYGLELNPIEQFSVERRRGWSESPDTPLRNPRDGWDERRRVEMQKPQPGGRHLLHVDGTYAGFRESPDWYEPATYFLTRAGTNELTVLEDVQWADWDERGRLLAATTAGAIEVRELSGDSARVVFGEDLARLRPEPAPAPAWAAEW